MVKVAEEGVVHTK
jgi:hypothetical protein